MINEKGIVSLTALCMMLIISLMIAGVANVAARQADITRYFKFENQLQNVAESAFNETVVKLLKDSTYGGKLRTDDDIENKYDFTVTSPDCTDTLNIDDIIANVYIKKFHVRIENSPTPDEDTHYFRVMIISLAEKENYHYNKYSVYRRVFGYIEKKRIRNRETNDIIYEDEYKFKEYLY